MTTGMPPSLENASKDRQPRRVGKTKKMHKRFSRRIGTTMHARLFISVVLLVAGISSCSKEARYGNRIDPELIPQTGSLSLTGHNQLSVILSKSRELRITYDAGQTWQVIPSSAVADAFECATMINERRGWALNHQGHVFITDSGGATWTRISQPAEAVGRFTQLKTEDKRGK